MTLRPWGIEAVSKRDDQVWWGWTTVKNVNQIRFKPDDRSTHRWRLEPIIRKGNESKEAMADIWPVQRDQFQRLFKRVYMETGWTLAVDELYYCIDVLDLETELKMLITQGRSDGISLVCGVQRPSEVRFFLSESRYVVAFKIGSGLDRQVLGQHFGKEWAETLDDLKGHQCSVIDKSTGEYVVTNERDILRVLGGKAA